MFLNRFGESGCALNQFTPRSVSPSLHNQLCPSIRGYQTRNTEPTLTEKDGLQSPPSLLSPASVVTPQQNTDASACKQETGRQLGSGIPCVLRAASLWVGFASLFSGVVFCQASQNETQKTPVFKGNEPLRKPSKHKGT